MNNLSRFYNKNRIQIFIILIIIIFAYFCIQTLNNSVKEDNERQNLANTLANTNETTSENNVYVNESYSMVTGGTVSQGYNNIFSSLVDNFFKSCIEGNPEKAYALLSKDCKEIMFPTQSLFIKQYYESKFNTDKTYSFQSWTSSDTAIYLVKIFDNMMSTGISSIDSYIQDYVSVVREDDSYKLNINNYIGRKTRNKISEQNGLKVVINYADIFMDYEIYSISITNNSENTILLDTRNNVDTIYVVDENGAAFEALLYENRQDDLIIEPKESKNIKIKFSNSYREKSRTKEIIFSDIVPNYEEYLNEGENYNERYSIEIQFF